MTEPATDLDALETHARRGALVHQALDKLLTAAQDMAIHETSITAATAMTREEHLEKTKKLKGAVRKARERIVNLLKVRPEVYDAAIRVEKRLNGKDGKRIAAEKEFLEMDEAIDRATYLATAALNSYRKDRKKVPEEKEAMKRRAQRLQQLTDAQAYLIFAAALSGEGR